jgi:uncharacterized protein (TIGR03118 family)
MYRPHGAGAKGTRQAVVLIVVLLLLTLFAVLGLTFALYAGSAAISARLAREAESQTRPDVEPEFLLAYFLGQLLYDVDDATGAGSALRGHSLARSMYGWNADDPASNAIPFNGTGRLHELVAFPVSNGILLDGSHLVNYTCFRKADGSLTDGFLRDPERLGLRDSLRQKPGPFTGGFNAPYTYPDLNNMFLAAVQADGTVLVPSFHRAWTGFGPLGPDNPNWYDQTKPWLKYLVLRLRPAEMGPGFPAPDDAGGDVKNLSNAPGGNDSIWLDLDFPVLTTPDGRQYKPLFAPLIVDLDNRVNVNVHGNVRGADNQHRSNQGWGPWEVNPGWVLAEENESANLLLGARSPWRMGRYGADRRPGLRGQSASFCPSPHTYAQVDFDGANEGPGGAPTQRWTLPGAGGPPLSCFPTFPAGYGNGFDGPPHPECWEHPLLSDPFLRTGDDRAFAASNLEALLRYGDTGAGAFTSELLQLCPVSLQNPRARRLVTTHSWDLDQPGVMPWLFDRDSSAYQAALAHPDRPPTGPPVAFPTLALRRSSSIPENSDFRTPGANPASTRADWRDVSAALGRVDLNRFLPPYRHQGRGLDLVTYSKVPQVGPADRFDLANLAVREQFLAAQAARQRLADDVYRRLLAVTGVTEPQDPAHPTETELVPRRWLAQFAVNVVDFIDEDDLSTPFNFCTPGDAGTPGFNTGAVSAANPELPRYWVFGTELPRVIVNEVLTEYQLPPGGAPGRIDLKVWVELFNPLPPGPPPAGAQPLDAAPTALYVAGDDRHPGYAPYQVVIANTNASAAGPLLPRSGSNGNVLGTPDLVRAATSDADFAPATGGFAPQSFLLLGPPGVDARGTLAVPRVPANVSRLRSPGLQYAVAFTPPTAWTPDERPAGITVLLRRLANLHLPFDPRPAAGGSPNPVYNPYVTIDYLQGIPLNDATNLKAVYTSMGKKQPYAADPEQTAPQESFFGTATGHTLGRPNEPLPPGGSYDWLVHLDRPLISPMELLHVSGYAPHQLTHRFISHDDPAGPATRFNHVVPWFDEDNRLYRIFEFLDAGAKPVGIVSGGRLPGKVNLNTIWDPETLLALCDPQPANHFTAADIYNPNDPLDSNTVYGRLLSLRAPGAAPGPGDRPFRGLAVGRSPGPSDAAYPPEGDPLFPNGSGIDDTLLRAAVEGGGREAPRLFEVPGAHPYFRFELLTKLFNQVTARSNIFAVWPTGRDGHGSDRRDVHGDVYPTARLGLHRHGSGQPRAVAAFQSPGPPGSGAVFQRHQLTIRAALCPGFGMRCHLMWQRAVPRREETKEQSGENKRKARERNRWSLWRKPGAVLFNRMEGVMRTWFHNLRQASGSRWPARRPSYRLRLEYLEERCLLSNKFVEVALVSDIAGVAPHTDPAVVNPWGFTESPRGEFLLSDNGSGTAALFAADGTPLGAPIVIPPPSGSPAGSTSTPNGQVTNDTSDFVITEDGRSAPAAILFSTEDGTIAGFNSAVDPSQAIIGADQSPNGAVYKLLALGSAGGANYLYATDFHNGTVDVFDKNFALHTFFAGQFTDPHTPAGFAPFGVKNINGILFVTYAKQDDDKHDDVAGAGNGFIDEFDTHGHFLKRFASGTAAGGTLTALNSPIGMTTAPNGFGNFGGDLLVGNFGDSHVSVFDLKTGRFLGQLMGKHDQPLVLNGGVNRPPHDTKGLWGIAFGNGQGGAGKHTLFFASGPNDETDGVFGKVTMPD